MNNINFSNFFINNPNFYDGLPQSASGSSESKKLGSDIKMNNNGTGDEFVSTISLANLSSTNNIKSYEAPNISTEVRSIGNIRWFMSEFNLNLNNAPPDIYIGENQPITIDDNLMKDANKLAYAYDNGMKPVEIFVPKFNTKEDATNNLKAGDVFQVKDANNISIVLSDGSAKELNLSPEKYMELFPPVEKYSINQGKGADCYLLSTLDGMMKTPNGFAQILSCFTEQEDGSVSVKYPNGMYNFVLENGKNVSDVINRGKVYYNGHEILNEDNQSEDFIAQTASGIQMLEYLYGFESINESDNSKALISELNKEKPDFAKIAELQYYYQLELKNSANEFRLNGGETNEVFRLFSGTKKDEQAKDYLLNEEYFKQNPEKLQNIVCVAGINGFQTIAERQKYGLSLSHAYSIRPYFTEDKVMKYHVSDPYKTGYSLDLTFEDAKKLLRDVAIMEIDTPK